MHAEVNLATVRLDTDDPAACHTALMRPSSDGLVVHAAGVLQGRAMARAMACGKHYRYVIATGSGTPQPRTWSLGTQLDVTAMQRAAADLVGIRDFSAFRDGGCSAKNPVKHLRTLTVREAAGSAHDAPTVVIDFEGSGFLRKMARIIVGTLTEVGQGLRPADSLPTLLASGRRENAGNTAPAAGLTLMTVWCEAGWEAEVTRACGASWGLARSDHRPK